MSKVTSKLQVTVPKALAQEYGIAPGDDIRFEASGEVIRVVPPSADAPTRPVDIRKRLALFDAASARQRARESASIRERSATRGWTREELYQRGDPQAD
ncbi:MAG: AbrB/MazE/SpoVT family DNA-binding domain-containing protein [Gammaproteobacteria bacterium]|nr:AbrB/MazE/SpoVT family DNA-binding domain-containing protein [Gammaproteobacteria bacterium]